MRILSPIVLNLSKTLVIYLHVVFMLISVMHLSLDFIKFAQTSVTKSLKDRFPLVQKGRFNLPLCDKTGGAARHAVGPRQLLGQQLAVLLGFPC